MMALSRIKPALEMRKLLNIKMATCKTVLQVIVFKVNMQTKSLFRLTHAIEH